jgi:hypothetical protein
MVPDILDSNPIFVLCYLCLFLQCQQSAVQVFGKITLVQGMIEHLSLMWVWGNFVPPLPYPARLRYLGMTIQILSM